LLDLRQLDGMKLAETPDQLRMRNRNEALGVERTLAQERDRDSNFEPGATDTRGVGNERNERAIFVTSWHAHYQGRPYLGGEAQVNEPDLTPPRGSQA
jgi:hypothetical protein